MVAVIWSAFKASNSVTPYVGLPRTPRAAVGANPMTRGCHVTLGRAAATNWARIVASCVQNAGMAGTARWIRCGSSYNETGYTQNTAMDELAVAPRQTLKKKTILSQNGYKKRKLKKPAFLLHYSFGPSFITFFFVSHPDFISSN